MLERNVNFFFFLEIVVRLVKEVEDFVMELGEILINWD